MFAWCKRNVWTGLRKVAFSSQDTETVGQVVLCKLAFAKYISVRILIWSSKCLLSEAVISRHHIKSVFWKNRKMCDKFDWKWAPWSASRNALSTSWRCWAVEAWAMVSKVTCIWKVKHDKIWKVTEIVCWRKKIFRQNLAVKQKWRKQNVFVISRRKYGEKALI